MKIKKYIKSIKVSCIVISLLFISTLSCFADSSKVVTIGENLNSTQKTKIFQYFGVSENDVDVITVNNQDERKYLEGVATEEQIGHKTLSCAYIEPTNSGGVNAKIANLNWVTASMISSTLITAGVENANVIAVAPFEVSGTGALTGCFKAFEAATGKQLDEEKKEIATEELVITGDLGEDIGQEKATGVVNDVKKDVIKEKVKDTETINKIIDDVSGQYGVSLSAEQKNALSNMMLKVGEQDYDYSKIENSLNKVTDNVNKILNKVGTEFEKSGLWDSIKSFFVGLFSGEKENDNENLGILNNTNDTALGENTKIDSTNNNSQLNNQNSDGFWDKFKKMLNL
ncbi:DUF1002 domain-containing protein [Clostridioides sp. GD02377]|uniref:DUF1002 domain-containing protein n=1 Tax=unclassified Clostridioides TaxID=2635829 RepID=UPI0038AD9F5C